MSETVRTALTGRGFVPFDLSWPVESASSRSLTAAGPGLPDVAILLNDLESSEHLSRLASLVHEVPVPWVLLTSSARGPLWGAALELGARTVLASTSTLDVLVDELNKVLDYDPTMLDTERAELVRQWRAYVERMADTHAQLERLTEGEAQVLRLLRAGVSLCTIAEHLGVSESTVRGQVRTMLHKLGVGSQHAAVASIERVHLQSARTLREHLTLGGPSGTAPSAPV